ncbi:hypothetical protein BAUCODRAFT_70900 [Baudoinia panamericana UAMH 10762]|uniref:DDHD domain-containing protein n=1 Tax=Baudoinia panamericana (strain UAMH 10762) TaxID=717646 RepID=M2MH88_BAUPA|nr:uncharacterized protein BAUCODRAFT_70900 [Baudoinia panamericana UAMH 10762]EMC95971.1 hypothetical protein BAUCODRAFT_70900 [Baudoinia panamericana UAMH 10762]
MSGPDSASSSYLSKLSPWSRSRSPSIPPSKGRDGESEPLQHQKKGADHVISHKHRLSLRKYPRDCPPVRPCWFHAVDVPKRRPHPALGDRKEEKPATAPKKYAAFSITDSKAIEAAFQKLVQDEDEAGTTSLEQQQDDIHTVKVPVNEDYLFDVDVVRRELAPAYWLGPVYDVRRGTWFYQDGSTQRPCDENLAAQLEEGYLKIKPWRLPTTQIPPQQPRSASQPRGRPVSWAPGQDDIEVEKPGLPHSSLTPQPSSGNLRDRAARQDAEPPRGPARVETGQTELPHDTHRLFGAHMNSVVTYQDATTAWLLTDDFLSRMNYSVYQRFAGGGHFAGMRMTRGYINPSQKPVTAPPEKDGKIEKPTGSYRASSQERAQREAQDRMDAAPEEAVLHKPSSSETRRQNLQRHMSSLLEDPSHKDPERQDEELRKRDEREIEDDYRETEGDQQGREIEHLILVTHGIGQRLGLRLESVNFVHDVNTLRKTLKAVYSDSPDLRALNAELGDAEHVNSRVQVLPICWRHLLDFPKQSLKHNRKERDLADTDIDDEAFPSLEDITVEGVPAVRNLITDLALDILLYQSPAYKEHISRIVLSECNRIYHLFMERNPTFNGKISMVGHSLGSAIMFDLLCSQEQKGQPSMKNRKEHHGKKLDFEVEDFYALGSPIGLFQMLKGHAIAARDGEDGGHRRGMTTSMDDPMLDAPAAPSAKRASTSKGVLADSEIQTSSPRCAQIFNIFHPTDPISYRMEPLISPAMATLKPQPLPYTKRGIFGAPMGQGISGIGARVSQSVSSMWSSMASSLLTRGLGYTGTETAQLPNGQTVIKSSGPLSMSQGAGTNISAGVIPTAPLPAEGTEIAKIPEDKQERLASDALAASKRGQHPPTLIDADLETLYAGYQKRRRSIEESDAAKRDLGAGAIGSLEWQEAEERAKKLRREEEKVRRLNSNGRVDYAIQEGVFDINIIAAIASHLSYWSDEDVSHFIISQLLSRHRIVRPKAGGSAKAQD